MLRTHNLGELREENIGQAVVLTGWLHSVRDLGFVIFAVLRDFFGLTQVVISDDKLKDDFRAIPRESTVKVCGKVVKRSDPNNKMPTGQIEIAPSSVEVLGLCSEALPFEITESGKAREDLRLRYRYLDLRNEVNKNKLVLRSNIIHYLRNLMVEKGFLEIQTPILTSSSPEGARDFLVPSRLHKGKFYALPQAPQQFKQLLMVSGIDKYFQIAPCFRDEDARADRSPGEFYQLDLEMSYATQEDVFKLVEEVLYAAFCKFSDKIISKPPFERIKYNDSILRYGSDKPDLRNPLFISNVTEIFKDTAIGYFHNKEIRMIKVDNFTSSRKVIDEFSRYNIQNEGNNLAFLKYSKEGLTGSISKNISEKELKDLEAFNPKENTLLIFVVEEKAKVTKLSGKLLNFIAESLSLIDKNVFKFCWVIDYPMFEEDEETGKIEFSHNPFSMPQGGLDALNNMNPLDILAYQYDLVCNGIELSSGAVRNHSTEIMKKAFDIAGYTEQDIINKFPALYNAFKFGPPPHAGIAPGVDRMVMLIADEPSIREIIAFPMNKNAEDLMMNAPNTVYQKQLDDVSIKIVES